MAWQVAERGRRPGCRIGFGGSNVIVGIFRSVLF